MCYIRHEFANLSSFDKFSKDPSHIISYLCLLASIPTIIHRLVRPLRKSKWLFQIFSKNHKNLFGTIKSPIYRTHFTTFQTSSVMSNVPLYYKRYVHSHFFESLSIILLTFLDSSKPMDTAIT